MDKRSLFFVVALSLALFATNIFFTYYNDQKKKEWLDEQNRTRTQSLAKKQHVIEDRTVKASDLPLVDIYKDDSGSEFLTSGLKDGAAVLTLNGILPPPKEVFSRPRGTAGALSPLELATQDKDVLPGSPIVYVEKGKPKTLTVADWPVFGTFDLQLVSFHPEEKEHPITVRLGELVDGQFHSLELGLDVGSSDESIALMKVKGSYLPVGIVHGIKRDLTDLEEFAVLAPLLTKTPFQIATAEPTSTEEKFYVLENDVMQLVFSTKGGSLVEMNLPFEGKDHPRSVVKPIEVDKDIEKYDRPDSRFPSRPATFYTEQGPELVNKGHLGGFYPLIRRGLKEPKTQAWQTIPPEYYGLNIVSDYPEVASLIYQVKEFNKNRIVLEAIQKHRKITKTFTIPTDEEKNLYVFDLDIQIEGDTRGLWLTTGIPEAEWVAGGPAPALKYRTTKAGKSSVEQFDLPQTTSTISSINPDWICNSNGFFGVIINPLDDQSSGFRAVRVPGLTAPSRLTLLADEFPQFTNQELPGYQMLMPLPQNKSSSFRLFTGPFDTNVLEMVDKAYTDPVTHLSPDYLACQTFHGWFSFISEPFANFLFFLMRIFHSFTNSWGLSIILITVVLRILLYPLNTWSTRSMLAMQEIAPQIQAIQEKYKNNKEKSQAAIMELYKEKKVNPFSGCLPLLIQMPFLIGMFDLLKSSFELRGAVFIPGWIDNLAAPDVVFSWKYSLPLIGSEFHLLPILLGGVMWLQSWISSTAPKDVSQMTDQQRQQRSMSSIMAVVFTVMFYQFPSGLNIYWLSSMLLGVLQTWWMGLKKRKV